MFFGKYGTLKINPLIFLKIDSSSYNPVCLMFEFWLCLLTSKRFYVVHGTRKSVKCFSTTLLSYEPAPLDGLSEHYSYRRQAPRGVIRTVLQHNITVLCVYNLFLSFVDIIHGYAEDMSANFHWKCLLVKLSARNLHCYIFI